MYYIYRSVRAIPTYRVYRLYDREAIHLQCFTATHYVSGHCDTHMYMTTFAQNCNIGNLLASCGSTMHVATL